VAFLALTVTTRNEAAQQSDGNSKSQLPSSKELPIFNHQNGHNVPLGAIEGLDFAIYLELGFWDLGFFTAWQLLEILQNER